MVEEQQRLSNGARAAQIAAEEFSRVESERDELQKQLSEMTGRLMEQQEQLARAEREWASWMQKALALAGAIKSSSTVLLTAANDANAILERKGDYERQLHQEAAG